MDLTGKTVKYYCSTDQKRMNSNQPTCPALVVADLNPGAEPQNKYLNLRPIYDGPGIGYETSVPHVSVVGQKSWELYAEKVDVQAEPKEVGENPKASKKA